MFRRCQLLMHRAAAPALAAAPVPANYSNTPYQKVPGTTPSPQDKARRAPVFKLAPPVVPPLPAPLRPTLIDSHPRSSHTNKNNTINSFRSAVCGSTDLSMRPMLLLSGLPLLSKEGACTPAAAKALAKQQQQHKGGATSATSYGEALQELSARWAAKFYGQVTFGPRNYPYPSSRWLARRFQMKKHRILKRFRFRRYKLAAVANLPFAKMVRVGMLPELKSSKTKKGDAVDAGLSSQLVQAARSSSAGGKTKGKRSRPRSKYQV